MKYNMKNKYMLGALLVGITSLFASCTDDNDSNPTLIQPTEFTLNTPAYANGLIDLEKTTELNLTWSQPKYTAENAPINATYEVQVSPTNSFTVSTDEADADESGEKIADYAVINKTTTLCNYAILAKELNDDLNKIFKWEGTDQVPTEQNLSVRVNAFVAEGDKRLNEIISNSITLKVCPRYVKLKDADPELWYLIGADICDGSWGASIGKSIIPMQTVSNNKYDSTTGQGEITWTGYLAGNGFKLKNTPDNNWVNQWGQGDAFGTFVKNDGGSGNITVTEPGYYTVTLNTAQDILSIMKYESSVTDYSSICIAGDMYNDGWADHAMTPCFSFDGAKNHDWYTTITVADGQGFKFKEAGSWDYNTGGPVSYTVAGDGYGYGTNNGDNISLAAGTYLVIYNDITRYYRCIRQ